MVAGSKGNMSIGERVTLIICTRNRCAILKETLPKWLDQADRLGINTIVLDNMSEDGTPLMVAKLQAKHPLLGFKSCPIIGIGANRAHSLKICETELLAYGDDDAYPADDWADVLSELIKQDFTLIGGVYLPWYKFGKPGWYRDRFASNASAFKSEGIHQPPAGTYASAGNMILRVKEAREVGGFNPELGHKGSSVAYGEETLLQVKLLKAGYSIHLSSTWKVFHVVFPRKLKMRWFFLRRWSEARAAVVLDFEKQQLRPWRHLFKVFFPFPQLRNAIVFLKNDEGSHKCKLFVLNVLWDSTYSLGYVFFFLTKAWS